MAAMSEPIQPPARDPRHPFVASPFTRLARTHAFSVGGDALFAVGLAGTVFFSVSPTEAPQKVGLYLLLTFAPFALAAPFIGPFLDRVRGGRRWMLAVTLAVRAVLCVLIVRDLNSISFYFEAFLMLVFAKIYMISRAALVPTTVRSDRELVEANSKLALLSGIAAVVAGGPGLLLLKLGGTDLGPQLTVGLAAAVYAVGIAFAVRLPKVTIAPEPPDAAERLELRSAGIRLAASAMALMRGAVGFLFLLVAFAYKHNDLKTWTIGAAVVCAQGGVLFGAGLAPRLRQAFTESRIMVFSLATTMVGGIVATVLGGPVGALLLSFLLGTTAGTAKQAFDALVQRDAPDANRGRSFARFETRFQLTWVVGAAIPLIVPIPLVVGYAIVAIVMGIGLASYWYGTRRVAKGTYDWESPSRRLVRRGLRKVDAQLGRPGFGSPPVSSAESPGPPGPPGPPDPTQLQPAGAPLAAAATGTARRGAAEGAEWTPPAGFVSRQLNDDAGDPTTVEPLPPPPAPAPPPAPDAVPALPDPPAAQPSLYDCEADLTDPGTPRPDLPPPTGAPSRVEQPALPLDFEADVAAPSSEPAPSDPPRWRDS
jgi:hypothetical protein